jgi:hypothetical protein
LAQGLNDKLALLDGAYGYEFFARQLLDYYFNWTDLALSAQQDGFALPPDGRPRLTAPEQYLRAVLRFNRVPTRQVAAEVLPVITSRVGSKGEICIAPEKLLDSTCVPSACEVRWQVYCGVCRREQLRPWHRKYVLGPACARETPLQRC